MKYFLRILSLSLLLLLSPSFAASESEISHLLDFVAKTQCEYERNGTRHKGPEARKHIERKYDYYHDDIATSEDFIRLSATKSTMSGQYYKIHCPNKPTVKSKDWLLAELKRFRGSSSYSQQRTR